jgi:hypothetical protein
MYRTSACAYMYIFKILIINQLKEMTDEITLKNNATYQLAK